MSQSELIDLLERDLGMAARLSVIANCGGQRRHIPALSNVERSSLAMELGLEIASWLAMRYGGDQVEFPSRHAMETQTQASRLRAAVLDAGLTQPVRSANDIAAEYGVTARRVKQLRQEMRGEATGDDLPPLPLFGRR